MFQKDGSSTLNGKKDVPIRKSDRRKLRDRVVDVLFTGGGCSKEDDNKNNDAPSEAEDGQDQEEWVTRAEQLIDDCIVAPKGGEVLSRKMKLMGGGEHATLYLRTPSSSSPSTSSSAANSHGGELSYNDVLKSYPTTWPYYQSTQPILLEYEDSDRKVNLIPLLPLLAAIPPPLSSPPLGKKAGEEEEENPNDDDNNNKNNQDYRIPNIIIHSEVSKYICRGADLMKSGIRSFPSPWKLRQSKGVVSISIIGNAQPVAVGMIEGGLFREYCYPKNGNNRDRGVCWRDDAVNLVGPGKKGIAVKVVSCYGDDLWKNSLPSKCCSSQTGVVNLLGGGMYDDGNYGNQGFVDGARVYPLLDTGENESDTDDEVEEEVDATAEMEQMNLYENKQESTATASDSATNVKQEDKGTKEAEQQEDKAGPDHDEILENAFYRSLLLMLSSKTPLPMPVSTYYAKHLLAAVDPTGHRLDMKQTSYKKIGPFLKDMQSNGVIRLGASKDGKDKCAFLTEIVKNNPDLLQFKRSWKKELEASGGDLSSMKSASSQKTKLAVVDLFLVPRNISDGMQLDKDAVLAVNAKSDERKGTGFLTKTECRALIEGYIEKEKLIDTNGKGRVLVNGPLCDAIFRLSKKNKQPGQNVEYPTSVKRKELIEKWLDRMDKGHAIVQMPGSNILHLGRGDAKPVDIEVEFRQGNRRKFLTRLRGMEEYGIDGTMLSQDVSHRFACSSMVETNPVGRPALKKGRVEIVCQGHLSEELTALLTGDDTISSHGGAKGSEYSLPKSVINVIFRKGVTKKKR